MDCGANIFLELCNIRKAFFFLALDTAIEFFKGNYFGIKAEMLLQLDSSPKRQYFGNITQVLLFLFMEVDCYHIK
jgi:hypothetical protein